MSSLTSWLIIIPTVLNIARRAGAAVVDRAARRGDEKVAETTGHVWDGDLTEYNKPLPRWWLVLFVLTVLFGIAYLVIYPGLGSYSGTQRWSQVRRSTTRSRTRRPSSCSRRRFAPYESRTGHGAGA